MKLRSILSLLLTLVLLAAPAARAVPPPNVQTEVSFLLGAIERSGCRFYRNGTWYDARAAQEHLRDKYQYLVANDLINTTEDFIERAATASSFSGRAYQIRCNDGAAVTSHQWLNVELARFRTPMR